MAAEFEKIEDFMQKNGIKEVKRICTTHKHWDHANGNEQAIVKFPECQIFGGEHDGVKACTWKLKD